MIFRWGGGASQVNECVKFNVMQRIISNVAKKKSVGGWPPVSAAYVFTQFAFQALLCFLHEN